MIDLYCTLTKILPVSFHVMWVWGLLGTDDAVRTIGEWHFVLSNGRFIIPGWQDINQNGVAYLACLVSLFVIYPPIKTDETYLIDSKTSW